MLEIRSVPGPPLDVNCYLVADRAAGEAVLIDAPWQLTATMQELAAEWGVTIRQIICTHGHWDHIMGLAELSAATGATVACHRLDADLLKYPTFAPFSFPFALTPVTPDRLLDDGDEIALGSHTLIVLHTPGHTPGCICLYAEEQQMLFSGDTLFAGTYGRLDLPGGDEEQMVQSLLRLRRLPANTRVFPGHGGETTIGRERWLAQVEEM